MSKQGRKSAVEAEIREALADPNASYVEVAKKVGRAVSTVRYHAVRWGLERNTRDITDEQREKIRRMLRAGCWAYWQIAEGAGCSIAPVNKEAKRLGIANELRKPEKWRGSGEAP